MSLTVRQGTSNFSEHEEPQSVAPNMNIYNLVLEDVVQHFCNIWPEDPLQRLWLEECFINQRKLKLETDSKQIP
jgi:hypothetical protein